jgi:simple sugar transport system substrate-binding protein
MKPVSKSEEKMKQMLRMLIVFLVVCVFSTVGFAASNKDIKITFFPGGPEGGPFASIVYNGARLAEQDLGVTVEYVWSDWLSEKMISQFKSAIARNPDGIAIMGHPGDDAYSELIDRARARGIIVTSQNTELPKNQAKYGAEGFGYVGASNYSAGINLGNAVLTRANLKPGDRAMVWGLLNEPSRGLRTKGAIEAMEKGGVKVDYIEISPTVNSDASQGIPIFTSYVVSHKDVKAIILDHGALTATAPNYMKSARKNPGDIYIAGFDLSPPTAKGIKEGYINAVLDQQPFLQGYLPVLQIYLTKRFGFSGLHVDTGAAIIDKSNIDMVAPLAEKGIR